MNPLLIPSGVRPTGETNTYRVASASEPGMEYMVVIGLGCDCPNFRMGAPARVRRLAQGAVVWAGGTCKHYRKATAAHGILCAAALDGKKYLGP